MKAAHRIGWRILWASAIVLFLSVSTALPDDEPAASAGSINEQVDELIQAWNHPSFSTRRAASQKVEELGAQAYEPLATAAIQGNSEIVHRVLEILKRGSMQSDPATKNAAKQAIDRIATSCENSASRAATEIRRELETPESVRRARTLPAAANNAAIQAQRRAQAIGIRGAIQILPGNQMRGNGMPGMQVPGLRIPAPRAAPGIMPGFAPPRGAAITPRERELLTRMIGQLDASLVRDQEQLERTKDPRLTEYLQRSIERRSQEKALLINELIGR